MKYAKILGLAALLVVAAMALSVSSASAETGAKICSTEAPAGNPACATGHGRLWTSSIDATLAAGNSATLTVTTSTGANVRTVTCTTSTVGGTVTDAANGTGQITAFNFSNCSSANCTNVTASAPRSGGTAFPWTATVTTETAGVSNTNGIMHVTNANGQFTATCSGITSTCGFETASATVKITGSDTTTAIVHAENVPLELKSGLEFICGKKADWSATYTVTTPDNLVIE